jgi:Polyketide cyclase / dehydrase and lipid transport
LGRFSEAADVRSPVEATFAYVTDQDRLAEWNDHVQWAEVVGGGPVGVGSKLRQHRRRNRREFDLLFQVTCHDPPHRHVVEGSVLGVDTQMGFTLEPKAAGTRVTMTADVHGRGVRRLLAPMVTREMRRSTVAALAALQARLGAP